MILLLIIVADELGPSGVRNESADYFAEQQYSLVRTFVFRSICSTLY